MKGIDKLNKWRRYRKVKILGENYFLYHERFIDKFHIEFYITKLYKDHLTNPDEIKSFTFESKNTIEMYSTTIETLNKVYSNNYEIGDDMDF